MSGLAVGGEGLFALVEDAGQLERFGNIHFEQFSMRVGATQQHANQRIGGRQIRGVACRTGDLLNPVDKR